MLDKLWSRYQWFPTTSHPRPQRQQWQNNQNNNMNQKHVEKDPLWLSLAIDYQEVIVSRRNLHLRPILPTGSAQNHPFWLHNVVRCTYTAVSWTENPSCWLFYQQTSVEPVSNFAILLFRWFANRHPFFDASWSLYEPVDDDDGWWTILNHWLYTTKRSPPSTSGFCLSIYR